MAVTSNSKVSVRAGLFRSPHGEGPLTAEGDRAWQPRHAPRREGDTARARRALGLSQRTSHRHDHVMRAYERQLQQEAAGQGSSAPSFTARDWSGSLQE